MPLDRWFPDERPFVTNGRPRRSPITARTASRTRRLTARLTGWHRHQGWSSLHSVARPRACRPCSRRGMRFHNRGAAQRDVHCCVTERPLLRHYPRFRREPPHRHQQQSGELAPQGGSVPSRSWCAATVRLPSPGSRMPVARPPRRRDHRCAVQSRDNLSPMAGSPARASPGEHAQANPPHGARSAPPASVARICPAPICRLDARIQDHPKPTDATTRGPCLPQPGGRRRTAATPTRYPSNFQASACCTHPCGRHSWCICMFSDPTNDRRCLSRLPRYPTHGSPCRGSIRHNHHRVNPIRGAISRPRIWFSRRLLIDPKRFLPDPLSESCPDVFDIFLLALTCLRSSVTSGVACLCIRRLFRPRCRNRSCIRCMSQQCDGDHSNRRSVEYECNTNLGCMILKHTLVFPTDPNTKTVHHGTSVRLLRRTAYDRDVERRI